MYTKKGSWTPTKSTSHLTQSRRSRFQYSDKYALRLQNCMPLKFKEMVMSQLSAVLDLEPEQLQSLIESASMPLTRHKSSLSFSRKKVQKLTTVPSNNLSPETLAPVHQLINYLSQTDIVATEGIFRKTGNISRQKHLKSKLQSATLTQQDMTTLSPHDCANVLKNFLNNQPEPILTQKLLKVYFKIANIARPTSAETKLAKINAMQLVLQLLPDNNTSLLKPLITMLNRAASDTSNLMTAYSLGLIFAPHLLFDRSSSADSLQKVLYKVSELVILMIEHGAQIFNTPKALSTSAAIFWKDMEVPNQLYNNAAQANIGFVRMTPFTPKQSPKVHIVDLQETTTIVPETLPSSPLGQRKRLSSDTSYDIPEKRPSPEVFLSSDCNVFDVKPRLSKQNNSIILHTKRLSEKPVARVKPIQHSPISQFLKSVPTKLQRVMSTPRSRTPLALFQF